LSRNPSVRFAVPAPSRRGAGAGLAQQVGGQRQPPACQERHRGLADQLVEAARERRARDTAATGVWNG
jgi:hypothetical protein